MPRPLKTIARRLPLYPVYRRIADGRRLRRRAQRFWEWSADDQKRFAFYRQFIADGDLVFDIGANLGNRAKVFWTLGAAVVAVEPQAACCDFLVTVFSGKRRFHLVPRALGAAAGQAEMMMSTHHPVSSLSPNWVRSVKASGRFAGCAWDRTETVSLGTLDELVAQYGRPTFVKIDVEGFEAQVVAGLSVPVKAMSMEFTPEYMENTFQCIERLRRLGDVEFQISIGESMEFALPDWATADNIRTALSAVAPTAFGDLYARFATPARAGRKHG